ncbi:MAG TPA: hypothetical protein VLE73_00935 [Candidatus Saccharimonadales bacterium]|nr:hypothetical protein [Candidatus Saccharimonadales bacterium]
MLLVPTGYEEGFASQKELFELQDKTFQHVWEYGLVEPARTQHGFGEELVVTLPGFTKRLALLSNRLREVVPKAVDDLGLAGTMGIIAVGPHYEPEAHCTAQREVQYVVPHRSSFYRETAYVLQGDNLETIDDDVARARRFSRQIQDIAQSRRALSIEADLGFDRMSRVHHRALSAIIDTCIAYPELQARAVDRRRSYLV